jgi:hypothetical protein
MNAKADLHIICERDVGLFSLFQQVVANIPWALVEHRIPVVYFSKRCCYWTPEGHEGSHTVWEYYFEPLIPEYGVKEIPRELCETIDRDFPDPFTIGYPLDPNIWVSNNFGDYPSLKDKALTIPYTWDDPNDELRGITADLIRKYVRPRSYIQQKVNAFFEHEMQGYQVIGVHIRGTDSVSSHERREFRKGSLVLENYSKTIENLLKKTHDARIFVATDDQRSLDFLRGKFGDCVISYNSLRHQSGETAGLGPTGCLIPAYIAGNRELAAMNGEEAIIEFLLLCRCQHLVHNGASLARTVLLSNEKIVHTNVHRPNRYLVKLRLINRDYLIKISNKPFVAIREALYTIKRRLQKKSVGWISANPNPIYQPDGSGLGEIRLSWQAQGTESVEVRLNSPDGLLFSRSLSNHSETTGKWVTDGMTFYLQDASGGDPCAPENTLSKITIRLICWA